MNKITRFCFALIGCFFCSVVMAQEEGGVDLMRSNGKIFVVMTVVLTILIGLFIYLFSIDKKITRLEKDSK